MEQQPWWTVEIEGVDDFDTSMKRIYAWYENEMIDRPPVRFAAHNASLESARGDIAGLSAEEKKAWWFDAELQLDLFKESINGRRFHGETFPVYFPNLGPDVYAAFYGAQLQFGEVTSWSVPPVHEWSDAARLKFDADNEYFRKLEELTQCALEQCAGQFLVGYTDLHPGLDCVAAWRDPQQLCFDMMDDPDKVKQLTELAVADFAMVYDHFDKMLKDHNQLSVSWMGIPSFGKMHIPSCDFSTMISPAFFKEFGLPVLEREVQTMTHNIFHVDGKGVARHLDAILSVPQVHALQWVQGVGDDLPIMQWVPFLQQLQAKKVPTIVDLNKNELNAFMAEMEPQGLFLWIATDNEEEELEILKRVAKWS